MFSDVWNKNAALFFRLMKIHSNPPIIHYRFNILVSLQTAQKRNVAACYREMCLTLHPILDTSFLQSGGK